MVAWSRGSPALGIVDLGALSPTRDVLLGLLISELAGQLDDSEGREGLQVNAAEVARRAAERLSEKEERS